MKLVRVMVSSTSKTFIALREEEAMKLKPNDKIIIPTGNVDDKPTYIELTVWPEDYP